LVHRGLQMRLFSASERTVIHSKQIKSANRAGYISKPLQLRCAETTSQHIRSFQIGLLQGEHLRFEKPPGIKVTAAG
jgi:hypothetical protein